MTDEAQASGAKAAWSTTQVYAMAAVCLLLGLALGYLFRGSQTRSAQAAASSSQNPARAAGMGDHPMPSLDDMKKMADTKAAPLLEQLKSDPNNAPLLIQVAKIYEATHQFKDAASYFSKSLEVNPKDVVTRTEMASCLYYDGDSDGAIAQLQRALQDQPKDADALFNMGVIKWQAKNDGPGAIAIWRQLLKTNPKLESVKKDQVQKLIAQAERPASAN